MGVAALRLPVGARSPRTSQKFCHVPLFIDQLLSRNKVLHQNQRDTPSFNCNSMVIKSHFVHINFYQSADNELRSIEEFESCAEDLKLDEDVVRDVKAMIHITSQGHFTEV